jgi:hypothetical protein
MRILIDIGHPGHVHLFKNFAKEMINRKNEVLFTTREKECEIELLIFYKFKYISFGQKYNSVFGKILGLFFFDIKMLIISIQFKPDLFLSHGSIYAAQVSKLMNKPHISFEDTGNYEQIRLYKPFTDIILTSDVFPYNYGSKQIRYNGHHEISYLLKKYFTPQIINKRYAIFRLVSWNASHDIGQSGIPQYLIDSLISILMSNNIEILISSEKDVPPHLEKYKIKIKPEEMHNYLANAIILIGEGATMAMEAALLGTPSIYVNTLKRSYCDDIGKWGLCLSSLDKEEIINFMNKVITTKKEIFQGAANKYIQTKIDVTSFTVWFVENYPNSVRIMKENPDYQYRFK